MQMLVVFLIVTTITFVLLSAYSDVFIKIISDDPAKPFASDDSISERSNLSDVSLNIPASPSVKPARSWVSGPLVVVPLLCLIGFFVASALDSALEKYRHPNRTRIERERVEQVTARTQFVNDWLESQRNLQTGSGFWLNKSWVNPVQLFAVKSCEIVDHDDYGIEFTLRIASSNRLGTPIEKLWTVTVLDDDNGQPLLSSVEDKYAD